MIHAYGRVSMIFFAHIPKCGGETCRTAFRRAPFGPSAVIKVWDPRYGSDVSAEGFATLAAERFENVRAVIGHVRDQAFLANPRCATLDADGRVTRLTVVREPVARLCSLFNYMRANPKHSKHEVVVKRGFEWFEKSRAQRQVAWLTPDGSDPAEEGADPETACREILARWGVLAIEDSERLFPQAVRQALAREGGEAPPYDAAPVIRTNVTAKRFAVSPEVLATPEKLRAHAPDVVAAIEDFYEIDAMLHRMARALSVARRAATRKRPA